VRVVLLTEGTYPYVRGGVSTWCDDLVHGLPDVEFVVYAIVGGPQNRLEYPLPENVTRVLTVPLWGVESLREYNHLELAPGRARDARALRSRFVPVFRALLEQIALGMQAAAPGELAALLAELYAYFREHDYDWTMRRDETWRAATDVLNANPWHQRFMTTIEAVETLRSIYRYLIPLAIEVPQADVYHTSASGLCALPAVVAHEGLGKPVLLTEHGVYLRERVLALARAGFPMSDRTVKKNFFSGIVRAAYHAADAVAPVCAYNSQWEAFYGVPEERVRVIYNGVDPARFPAVEPPAGPPTVVSVARIDPLKDPLTLIAAAAVVRQRVPGVRFDLWGPAPDLEYLRECEALIEELGLGETVRLCGATANPGAAYAAGHVVALSSVSEGFPYSVIEGMMCGRPVVATDVGGVREAVGAFGTVVPPRRPDRLGEALVSLLSDEERARELGHAARGHALEHFSRVTFLNNYRALYGELTQGLVVA